MTDRFDEEARMFIAGHNADSDEDAAAALASALRSTHEKAAREAEIRTLTECRNVIVTTRMVYDMVAQIDARLAELRKGEP